MKYAFTFLLAIILTGCGEPKDPRVGMNISTLSFKNTQLEDVALGGFSGKPSVINLWASWCTPCIKEMPSLMALQEHYQVILINTDAKQELGVEVLAKNGWEPEISLWDKQGKTMRDKLSAMQLPQTFITDSEMVVRGVEAGDKDWTSQKMLQRITDYLN